MPALERRVEALEAKQTNQSSFRWYLWSPASQTQEEALAAAGLADYEGETMAIRLVGIAPRDRY